MILIDSKVEKLDLLSDQPSSSSSAVSPQQQQLQQQQQQQQQSNNINNEKTSELEEYYKNSPLRHYHINYRSRTSPTQMDNGKFFKFQ